MSFEKSASEARHLLCFTGERYVVIVGSTVSPKNGYNRQQKMYITELYIF